MTHEQIIALRMERQFLTHRAELPDYLLLYRDMQPGQNVYWHGFGDPPTLTFRANFDDKEYNRARQADRRLIKGRFQGGTLGWITPEELSLFAALYQKPLTQPTDIQSSLLSLIERTGPLTIQQMKDETGLLVKQITPALHRLQEAFLIYEDQYDGEWDRGWYRFGEMFPEVRLDQFDRAGALKTVLLRFAYRQVWFCADMAKSFYRLSAKDIAGALSDLVSDGLLVELNGGYMLPADAQLPPESLPAPVRGVLVMHRNDYLVKSNEYWLKEKFGSTEHDILQYLLIDGEFHGAVLGHFRYGPNELEDVAVDLDNAKERQNGIISAVADANSAKPKRFMGVLL